MDLVFKYEKVFSAQVSHTSFHTPPALTAADK